METSRKFIVLFINLLLLLFKSRRPIISTDEDPSLRIESSAIINLRGVSTKLNKYIAFTCKHTRNLLNCDNFCFKT